MVPATGRVYHPAPDKLGGVGLIKSSIAIDLSRFFEFENGDGTQQPSYFNWNGQRYTLTHRAVEALEAERRRSGSKTFDLFKQI